MTLKIEITVPQQAVEGGDAARYLAQSLGAIGFVRGIIRPAVDRSAEEQIVEPETPPEEPTKAAEEAPKPAATRGRPRKTADKTPVEETPKAEDPPMNISTGEERIDPTNPEDAAQDAADEAEEAAKQPDLTHDDVRAALTRYVQKFGMAAAMEDGPKVIAMLCGEGKVKVSDIPATQEALRKAVEGIDEMAAKNPFKRGGV